MAGQYAVYTAICIFPTGRRNKFFKNLFSIFASKFKSNLNLYKTCNIFFVAIKIIYSSVQSFSVNIDASLHHGPILLLSKLRISNNELQQQIYIKYKVSTFIFQLRVVYVYIYNIQQHYATYVTYLLFMIHIYNILYIHIDIGTYELLVFKYI